ncbi:hypothetical protein [Serratia entomophila]|nr:hypothetical protein [Serratia entomophila]
MKKIDRNRLESMRRFHRYTTILAIRGCLDVVLVIAAFIACAVILAWGM